MTDMVKYDASLQPGDNPAKGIVNAIQDGVYSADMYDVFATSNYSRNMYHSFFNQLLEGGDGTTLWHGSSGKDRTGIATVLILSALGVSQDTIMQDYLLTNDFVQGSIQYMTGKAAELTDDEHILQTVPKVVGVDAELLNGYYQVMPLAVPI